MHPRRRIIRIQNSEDLARAPRRENGTYNLQGANLSDADLIIAQMPGANLRGANLVSAVLEGANLEEGDLRYAFLNSSNLQEINLQRANLQGATLVDTNLQRANLQGAILENAVLTGANLQGANLQGANLQGANLTNANLEGVNLEGAKGINLNQTRWTQDADCVGQEDPVSMDTIAEGRGFRLEAENRCYDVETMAQMKRLRRPLVGPMTRIPFTEADKRRIDGYIRDNPNPSSSGGKKLRTRRKERKGRKTRRGKELRTRRNERKGRKTRTVKKTRTLK